jgi:hypothetical protein
MGEWGTLWKTCCRYCCILQPGKYRAKLHRLVEYRCTKKWNKKNPIFDKQYFHWRSNRRCRCTLARKYSSRGLWMGDGVDWTFRKERVQVDRPFSKSKQQARSCLSHQLLKIHPFPCITIKYHFRHPPTLQQTSRNTENISTKFELHEGTN